MPEEQEKPKRVKAGESAGGAELPATAETRDAEEPKAAQAKPPARTPAKATPDRAKRGMVAVLGFKRKTGKLRPR